MVVVVVVVVVTFLEGVVILVGSLLWITSLCLWGTFLLEGVGFLLATRPWVPSLLWVVFKW